MKSLTPSKLVDFIVRTLTFTNYNLQLPVEQVSTSSNLTYFIFQ